MPNCTRSTVNTSEKHQLGHEQMRIIIILIINTCNAHISTLLGVQGAVKQKQNERKADTTNISP